MHATSSIRSDPRESERHECDLFVGSTHLPEAGPSTETFKHIRMNLLHASP